MTSIRTDQPTQTPAKTRASTPEVEDAAADLLVNQLAATHGAGVAVVNVAGAIGSVKAGDPYGTAVAAKLALNRVAPTLSRSMIGVGLDAVVLTSGATRIGKKQAALENGLAQLKQPSRNLWQSLYTVSSAGQQWALMGRAVANASLNITTWGLKQLGRVGALAPFAQAGLMWMAQVSHSPVGRILTHLNRLIPLLNIAFVVLAGRTAVQVLTNRDSSATSKALAITSVFMSVGVFAGGLVLTGWKLVGLIAASLILDFFLASSRAQDRRRADADAILNKCLKDPLQGFKVATQLARSTTEHVQENVQAAVTRLWDKSATITTRTAPQSTR